MRRLVVGTVVVAVVLALSGCDWPVVGFDAGRSASSAIETSITPRNVGHLTEQWTAPLVGKGSDPVVAGSQVYVTALGPYTDESPGSGLYAFDANGSRSCSGAPKTCAPLWSKFFVAQSAPASPTLSSPAVAGGRVYIGDITEGADLFSGTMHAFDTAGAPVFTAGNGTTGSPAPSGSLVYSNWSFQCCYGASYRGLQAQDGQSGAVRFGALLSEPTPPAVAGGVVYAGSASLLYAFDAKGVNGCSPFQYAPTFFPTICAPLWTGTLTGTVPTAAAPAVANGKVYQSAQDGQLDVFSEGGCGTSPCAPLWTDKTDAPLDASAAVTSSRAFVVSGSKLYAFNASGCGAAVCSPVWTAPLSGSSQAAPSVAGHVLYIGTDDGHIEAFDARGCRHATCSSLWSAATGGAVTTAPAVSNGRVFVADAAGTLHAYGLPPS